ncbi:MAG: TetR/AcrR family transcriptional regulator [Alphaproteobacteria bacterium]|nr:TetR/AcrR family transcriptional regulator [Alphaproteobacteria bacterium]
MPEPIARSGNRTIEGGLRERSKARKLGNIRRAARELFVEKGYDATTTRAIAKRAGVGLGTLFTYAADKRDLLFLIFNDELIDLAGQAFGKSPSAPALADRLVAVFHDFYAYFARQPNLARFLLRELTFYTHGPEAHRFQAHRDQIVAGVTALVARARADGIIAMAGDDTLVARAIFDIYTAEVRRWLAGDRSEPNLAQGLTALRRVLQVLVDGLQPRR